MRAANARHENQELARFTHFMLGESDVVIASRSRIGNLDGRVRLRRQLLATSCFTVTDAVTRANAGRDVGVRRDSSRRRITRE
jgi:hypothetical protein